MNFEEEIANIKNKRILVLYSTQENWTDEELLVSRELVEEMCQGLKKLGLDAAWKEVGSNIDIALSGFSPEDTVIFNWCEGYGDDGYDYWTVPIRLEELGYTYTGSGPDSLKNTTDKTICKEILSKHGVRMPKSKLYLDGDSNGWDTFPALIKPAREHSSYGITRESVVDDQDQMHKRIKQLQIDYGPAVLVEDFIEGAEFNVAIWGNDDNLTVLPIGMIDFGMFDDYHDRIVGFDAKWNEESVEWQKTQVVCPAPIGESLKRTIDEISLAAYRAMDCRDYARVDIRVRGDVPYVLEVNSNPDISPDAGFARSSSRLGYDYPMTIAKILAIAMKRREI